MDIPSITAKAQHPERSAIVEFDKTYLARPLDWCLRIVGQSVGGYGFIDDTDRRIPTSRHATREDAERVAAIWIETGLTPAYQTDERIAAVRAEIAASAREAA